MTTVLDARYKINGLIDTSQPVLANLEKICNASGCWLTYDIHEGKFAVVINKAGTSSFSFDDSNIIGPLTVATTAIDKLYNTVKVVYPHEDLKGQTDFIQISIPQVDRIANEFENVLNLNYGIVTNPVQAELLAFIELKQNRVDKIVQFRTDYSKIGIKAGDLIDITNTVYGFVAKVFRVITVSESDGEDGSININITALEYDASVYDEDMSRYTRTDSNGITPLASLPQPTKPTIVKTELATAPSVAITTTLTGGLVEHVEFWTSIDGGTVYTLLKTANPTVGSNVFPLSSNITIRDTTVAAGPLIVKCRATNKEGVSLFSTPSDSITFTPQQVPTTITDTTLITNNDGTTITGMLTLAALMKLLNDFFKAGGFGIQKQIDSYTATASTSYASTQYNAFVGNIAPTGNSYTFPQPWGPNMRYWGTSAMSTDLTITTTRAYTTLVLVMQMPQATYNYRTKIAGSVLPNSTYQTPRDIWAYIPTVWYVYYNGNAVQTSSADWQTQSTTVSLSNAPAGTYTIKCYPLLTYDIDQQDTNRIFAYNIAVQPQANGAGISLTALGYQ